MTITAEELGQELANMDRVYTDTVIVSTKYYTAVLKLAIQSLQPPADLAELPIVDDIGRAEELIRLLDDTDPDSEASASTPAELREWLMDRAYDLVTISKAAPGLLAEIGRLRQDVALFEKMLVDWNVTLNVKLFGNGERQRSTEELRAAIDAQLKGER